MHVTSDALHQWESPVSPVPAAGLRRFLAWLVAPGLERLALANQRRHK